MKILLYTLLFLTFVLFGQDNYSLRFDDNNCLNDSESLGISDQAQQKKYN